MLGIADHHELRAGPLLHAQQFKQLTGAELPELVDNDDTVTIERVLAALDTFDKGGDGGALLDAGHAEIASLSPGEGYAKYVAAIFLPGVDQRGEGAALA